LGTYRETTPSTLTGNELKPPYIYVTKTTTCYMVIDPPLLKKDTSTLKMWILNLMELLAKNDYMHPLNSYYVDKGKC